MRLYKDITLCRFLIDVNVIEALPAYQKQLALLKPLRDTPDGHVGVVYENKVFPLYVDCDGELAILLSGASFPLKNTKIPQKIPKTLSFFYIEEPTHQSSDSGLNWKIERTPFGINILLTAPDDVLERVIIALSLDMKLNIISWGQTLDPVWAETFDWSIRLPLGLSLDAIIPTLNRILNHQKIHPLKKEETAVLIDSKPQTAIDEMEKTAQRLKAELELIKKDKASILEQKEREIEFLYDELERISIEFEQYKLATNRHKLHQERLNQKIIKKRDPFEQILANLLFSCFPQLAFTPDAVSELKSRFQNSVAIWDILSKLNSGARCELEKVKGVAGNAGWLELRKHISTGTDKRGRVYCRRSNKKHRFDVIIHWKKDDKEQAQLFKKLANYPSFETNRTVFMQ